MSSLQRKSLPIGLDREARRCYGFDEVALAPAPLTIDPEQVEVNWKLGDLEFPLPIIASAMDGVVDPQFAIALGKLGGLAVLNLQGLQTRYRDPDSVISDIVSAPTDQVVGLIQKAYAEPVSKELVAQRISEIREGEVPVAISVTPGSAEELAEFIGPSGVDVFVVQSTVTTVRHESSRYRPPSFEKLSQLLQVPIMAGNCVTYQAAWELMEAGVAAVLVGVGPGAACTTRRVLGLGVPQITAVADVAAARDSYLKETGRRVAVIADGGMRVGGDLAKAIAAGADALMIGSPLAAAQEAPGKGYHWGMSTSDIGLPRGTRIQVGTLGTLREILLGPAAKDDGTMNLIGALKLAMGCCGAHNIQEMQDAELIIAPALPTEGKAQQYGQSVGTGSRS